MQGDENKIVGSSEYLKEMNYYLGLHFPKNKEFFMSVKNLLDVYGKTNIFHIQKTGQAMFAHMGKGMDPRDVFDLKSGYNLVEMGKLHSIYTTLRLFHKRIEELISE